MNTVRVIKPQYPGIFGGAGFHNNDATMYHIIEKDHFVLESCQYDRFFDQCKDKNIRSNLAAMPKAFVPRKVSGTANG